MFPQPRFVEAGASAQEIERLQAQFDALSPEAQASQLQEWAGVATGDLTAQLEAGRAAAEEEVGKKPTDSPKDPPTDPPEPNMQAEVEIGKDGTGYVDVVGLGSDPQGISQLQILSGDGTAKQGTVAIEPLPDNDPPLLRIVVSGAKPGSQVIVAYYSAPE